MTTPIGTVDDPTLVAALRTAAVVSAITVVALLLFYALELRSIDRHLFGPISDVGTAVWDVVFVVVVLGLRPALGAGRSLTMLVAATLTSCAAGAVAAALLVVGAWSFEVSTPVSILAVLVQSLWLHVLSRRLTDCPWASRVVRLGFWAPVAQGIGAVVVGASLMLGWGTTPQIVVMILGVALGLPAWLAWPVWFTLAAREVRRHGVPRLSIAPRPPHQEHSWPSSPESTISH